MNSSLPRAIFAEKFCAGVGAAIKEIKMPFFLPSEVCST